MIQESQTFRPLRFALGCYLLTAALVLGSAICGVFSLSERAPDDFSSAMYHVSRRWDAEWYLDIANDGYQYERLERGESVAFFPLFPVLVKAVSYTGLSKEWSGLICSQGCLWLAFWVFALYLQRRFPTQPDIQRWAMLAFALFPAGFFWRFLYSESLFLLLAITSLYWMERRGPLLVAAMLVGLTTATRPVGVALIPAFLHFALSRNPGTTRLQAIKSVLPYLPICCSGLLAYMAFLFIQFGEPLAFATTQHYWRLRPVESLLEIASSFAAWEPIWAVYVSDSYWYWGRIEEHSIPFLSLAFWNPIIFLSFVILMAVGWRRSWLRPAEVIVCAGLLLIPYFLRGFHFCMMSQARFAAVVFPVYIVIAHSLVRSPRAVRWGAMLFAVIFLTYFSARFAAGFFLI